MDSILALHPAAPGLNLGRDIFSLLLSLWTVLRSNPSSAKVWISQMQLAVTSRAKYSKKKWTNQASELSVWAEVGVGVRVSVDERRCDDDEGDDDQQRKQLQHFVCLFQNSSFFKCSLSNELWWFDQCPRLHLYEGSKNDSSGRIITSSRSYLFNSSEFSQSISSAED